MRDSSKLLLDEQPLQVIPSLAVKLGLNRATFLQQLHYWLQKSPHIRDGRKWIYNTFEEWHEQFPFWSAEAIRKIARQLHQQGLIRTTSRYNERKGDRTLWYTIDYEVLDKLFSPDESTEAPDQPEKSTEQPEKSTDLEPEKSTERYQRVPEKNNRDSVLQTGEPPEAASPPPKGKETEKPGAYANRVTAELIAAKEKQGKKLHEQTGDDKQKLGSQFAAELKKHDSAKELDPVLEYRVAKAAAEIDGEYPTWCSFRYALDRVNEGWRPKGGLKLVDEDLLRKIAENQKLEEDLLRGVS